MLRRPHSPWISISNRCEHMCKRVDKRVVVGGLCMCYSQKVNVKRERGKKNEKKKLKSNIKFWLLKFDLDFFYAIFFWLKCENVTIPTDFLRQIVVVISIWFSAQSIRVSISFHLPSVLSTSAFLSEIELAASDLVTNTSGSGKIRLDVVVVLPPSRLGVGGKAAPRTELLLICMFYVWQSERKK